MTRIRNACRRALLLVVIATAATSAARAQAEFDLRLFRPIVTVSAWGVPDADFTDLDGQQYGSSTLSFGANIPLGSTHLHPGGKVLGQQFLLGVNFRSTPQTIDGLDREPRLYDGGVTGTAIIAGSKGNLYLGSLGASFAEDEDTINDLDPRLFGLGLGSWRHGRNWLFIYGGSLSYVYARKALLPVFGFVWTPNTTWSLTATLPFYIRATQKLNDRLRLNYLLYVSGQRYRFANETTFPGEDPVVFERVRQSNTGVEIEWKATTDLALLAQGGIVGGRRLSFANLDEDDFVSDTIDPAPYLRLTLRWAFGKTLIEDIESRYGASMTGTGP